MEPKEREVEETDDLYSAGLEKSRKSLKIRLLTEACSAEFQAQQALLGCIFAAIKATAEADVLHVVSWLRPEWVVDVPVMDTAGP